MNKFLGGHKLLKFDYEYIESLNTLIANIENQFIVNNLPTKETPMSSGKFFQTFKEKLIVVLHKLRK